MLFMCRCFDCATICSSVHPIIKLEGTMRSLAHMFSFPNLATMSNVLIRKLTVRNTLIGLGGGGGGVPI